MYWQPKLSVCYTAESATYSVGFYAKIYFPPCVYKLLAAVRT